MKLKLYKASFKDAPEKSGCWPSSSDDSEIFITSVSMSDAVVLAEKEFNRWQAEDKKRKDKILESVRMLSDTIFG